MIVKATADREAAITKQLADAEKARADAAGYLEEQRAMLAVARGEAQGIVAEARQAGERERMVAIERTRTEQDELLARAKPFACGIRNGRLALEVDLIQTLAEDLNAKLMRRDPLSEPVHHSKLAVARLFLGRLPAFTFNRLARRT